MKPPFPRLCKTGVLCLVHVFLISLTKQATAGEQNAKGKPASIPKVEAFNAEQDEALLQTSKRALEEMRKHETQETIDNFIGAAAEDDVVWGEPVQFCDRLAKGESSAVGIEVGKFERVADRLEGTGGWAERIFV